jgi:hypothetical protein
LEWKKNHEDQNSISADAFPSQHDDSFILATKACSTITRKTPHTAAKKRKKRTDFSLFTNVVPSL